MMNITDNMQNRKMARHLKRIYSKDVISYRISTLHNSVATF